MSVNPVILHVAYPKELIDELSRKTTQKKERGYFYLACEIIRFLNSVMLKRIRHGNGASFEAPVDSLFWKEAPADNRMGRDGVPAPSWRVAETAYPADPSLVERVIAADEPVETPPSSIVQGVHPVSGGLATRGGGVPIFPSPTFPWPPNAREPNDLMKATTNLEPGHLGSVPLGCCLLL